MWFSRILRLLLTGPPEPLSLITEPGQGAYRGRYLHIEHLPFALGRMIGQGDEAMVFELISLRRGNCGYVVKICRYAPGTPRYERWAVPVRDETSPYAGVPDIERYPARLLEVPGGLVKVQQYITNDPATAWATPFPAADVYRYLEQYGPDHALRLAETLLEMYGPRGVLLQAKATCLGATGSEATVPAFEEAIEALTTERNASRFGAACQLARKLWEDYHNRPPRDGTLVLTFPDGSVHRQTFFAVPKEAALDDTDQDRPVMLLLEVLAEEPYLVQALALLVLMIADAPPAGPAVRAVVAALEHIDPAYDDLPRLRQIAEQFRDIGVADEDTPSGRAPGSARPETPDDHLARFDQAYQPEPVRGRQARGRFLAAQTHLDGGRDEEAERELRAAMALDPASFQYQDALVRLLGDTDRLHEARELAETVVRRFPDEAAAYESLGHVCVMRGEHQDGLLAFLHALRAEPSRPWMIEVKVGQTYVDLGEVGRALAFLRAAYAHAPAEPPAAVALAQVLRAGAGDSTDDAGFEEALAILMSAADRNPDSAEVLVCLAQSRAALREPEAARTLLVRAVEVEPDHPFAREFLDAVEAWLASLPPGPTGTGDG